LVRTVQLSERLPGTRHSALERPQRRYFHKKRRKRQRPRFSKDLPAKWNLFSRAQKK
jgi:hypothetical protein